MIMQPSTIMIKILVFRNYSVFDEPHFLKKLQGNLRVFLLIYVWLVDIYCTLTICLTCTRCITQGKTERESELYSMRIDSAERFAFSFIYRNAQFCPKTQSTFSMNRLTSRSVIKRSRQQIISSYWV